MGLKPIKSQSRTSLPSKRGGKRPYLLRDLPINHPDQVWCTDITYIPMRKGFAYVTMIMDWYSRAIISWQVSNTLDSRFCLNALREAVEKAKKTPQILHTDQGCQYTSQTWLETVEGQYKIQASMDGKGRWKDNVMIERLWRSLKHERLYLCAPRDVIELEEIVETWVQEYNEERPHQSHQYKTPWQIYRPESTPGKLFTSRFDSDELAAPILAEAIS